MRQDFGQPARERGSEERVRARPDGLGMALNELFSHGVAAAGGPGVDGVAAIV